MHHTHGHLACHGGRVVSGCAKESSVYVRVHTLENERVCIRAPVCCFLCNTKPVLYTQLSLVHRIYQARSDL